VNILGISGFERAMPFKRAHWPGLQEREYRISQGHDSAAALVVDGRPVAACAEERLNRGKHSALFPALASRYCLSEAGLILDDLDEIAHSFDYSPYRPAYSLSAPTLKLFDEVFSRRALVELVERDFPGFPAERVFQVPHHLAHAASAYFTSGWDECLTIVIDGMGEVTSATAYHARAGRLEKLLEISAQDSIGVLYSVVTLHLGFDFNADEYKIMGLAPYGDPRRFRQFFCDAVHLLDNGAYTVPLLRLNRSREERENYLATRAHLAEHLIAARAEDAEITQDHCDVAAALQECLDRTILHLCGTLGREHGMRRLAMAGGVALNCTANGRLRRAGVFDEIYIQPAAGDDGSALGAALYRASLRRDVRNERFAVPFLGPSHPAAAIDSAIAEFADRVAVTRFPDLAGACVEAARQIAAGRVVAWYRGRMEFGPRALGHRSILADPSHPEMRDRINSMVKMREGFRPFAPAVTREQAHVYFDVPAGTELPYMIVIEQVRAEHRDSLPAVTHVDGSARVQTVDARENLEFHTLLKAVGAATRRPMVGNTSINLKGQPIVNTPREAIETFLRSGMDALFLENTLVARRDS
jgi:carbamoyltransferase